MTNSQIVLSQRVTDSIARELPVLTRRDVAQPMLPGKALAVIGVRRAGKTSFLWQCLADRLAAGRPRESLVLLALEDDRLADLTAEDLSATLESYYRQYPEIRATGVLTLALDEVQVVRDWERFVRRVMDTERIELLLSGSSAKLLSREVATSLRGRALEVLVHPFSFREALRHSGHEPRVEWTTLSKEERSAIEGALLDYLRVGGFPEAQGLDLRTRIKLLRSYVDVVTLRDVIDRHAISNPVALRWMQRQLLTTPAGSFSANKLYQTMRSTGLSVGKDTVHDYLAHLEDAFLIRTVSMHSASERQRMVNPRKVYPIDPGLIELYESTGRAQTGHALETIVLLELERRGYDVSYVRTSEGYEVDFRASFPGEPPLLIQVCADPSAPETLERELRALSAAVAEERGARGLLLTLTSDAPASLTLPTRTKWERAGEWLLSGSVADGIERGEGL